MINTMGKWSSSGCMRPNTCSQGGNTTLLLKINKKRIKILAAKSRFPPALCHLKLRFISITPS
jgi:hypothetical protein